MASAARGANHIVLAIDGNLAGDDEGALVVAVLDDFEEIAGLIGRQGFRPPIVEDEQFDPSDSAQEPAIPRVAMAIARSAKSRGMRV